MYCPTCGSKLAEGTNFCNTCGAFVGNIAERRERKVESCKYCGKEKEAGVPFCRNCEKYCKSCGTLIRKATIYCPHCNKIADAIAVSVPQGSRMLGFGPALTGAILADVAVAMFTLMDALGASIGSIIIMVLLALGLSIPAIILGAKSIQTAKEARVKPIATLVLGIASVVLGGIAALGAAVCLLALL